MHSIENVAAKMYQASDSAGFTAPLGACRLALPAHAQIPQVGLTVCTRVLPGQPAAHLRKWRSEEISWGGPEVFQKNVKRVIFKN